MYRLAITLFCLMISTSSCKFARTVSITKAALKQDDESTPGKIIEVPFVYKDDWIHLLLKVKQEEHVFEGYFLFDTGAFTELFDSCSAIKVITPDAMPVPVKGAFGHTSFELKVAEEVTLTLDEFGVRKSKILVASRPKMFPEDCIGLLGPDFFRNCILQIDFQKCCLRIIPNELFQTKLPGLELDLTKNSNPFIKNLPIDGLKPQAYLFDLGSQQSIFIQKEDEQDLKQAMGDSILSYEQQMPGKAVLDASGIVPSSHYYVRYGAFFNHTPVPEFEISGMVNPDNALKEANLGLAFSRNVFSKVTIDFPNKRLYYEITTDRNAIDRMGREIYFTNADSSFLTGPVLTTSYWYRQGVRPGQKVLRINGENPQRYMEARRAGREISVSSLTIQTGDGERLLSRNP